MDYSILMLEELQNLEQLSSEYEIELKYLSNKIRKDFWQYNNPSQTERLSKLLHAINDVYKIFLNFINYFDIEYIYEYVIALGKYCADICPHLDCDYYNKLIDDIQLESAKTFIEKQWEDIIVSKDGLKSFKEIFNDLYSKYIKNHRDKFFHELSESDVLCRVVKDELCNINKERFIPRKALCNNRWNPPGEEYLYLSFSEKPQEYNDELSLNEYICLEEFRAKKGNTYYFCDFKPVKPGVIFDLSYNDVSIRQIKNILNDHINNVMSNIYDDIKSDPNFFKKYGNDKRKLRREIKSRCKVNKGIISESYAKQYLKIICSCIYKKVDELDEEKKELAYKSFQVLAKYFEEIGITGIIYPCTRIDDVKGKNLVLFNKYDAVPIESSIRECKYD